MMTVSVMLVSFPTFAASVAPVSLSTNSNSYVCMQPVGLYANLTSNGNLVPNGVLAVEVDFQSSGWPPMLLRSLKGSQNPAPGLLDNDIQVIVTPVDMNMVPQTGFKRGSWGYFNVTIVNSGPVVEGVIAWSAMDAASVPIGTNSIDSPGSPITIPTDSTSKLQASVDIPSWAAVGTATVYINIFSDAPYRGGYPIANEASCTFQIEPSFGPSAAAAGSGNRQSLKWEGTLTSVTGLYNFSYRVPPNVVYGTYIAYAVSSSAPTQLGVAKFQVTAASKPPQAIFTYSPSAPYANEAVYFDASSSYSYNGTITNYKWNWGDGSAQQSTPHPTITHVFKVKGAYAVTLNVTDSQGLWGLSEEPVSVSGPTPPVASFTFKPSPTWINASTTFDASASTPGWNGTGHPPISNYTWSFGDGTPVIVTKNSVIYHQFTTLGNFTATLNVTDTRGWIGTMSQKVQVINVTQHPDIAVTGVGFFYPPTGLYQIAPDYYQPYSGWSGYVLVSVLNNGTSAASFNVTLSYSNGTLYSLGTQDLTNVPSQGSIVLQYWWNTTLLKPTMNYTITANATILLGETNTKNNQYSIIAEVKGTGDVNGDGIVNILDIGIIATNWGLTVPPADPRADIVGNGGPINILDYSIVSVNWGKTY